MLLNLLKSDRDYVKRMFAVWNVLQVTAIMDANLTLPLGMTQQSKLGCWKIGLLHILLGPGSMSS
jgi:hypothetical protein